MHTIYMKGFGALSIPVPLTGRACWSVGQEQTSRTTLCSSSRARQQAREGTHPGGYHSSF
jgi:hypothetical protein